jgi:Homeodomain-like domain
VILAATASSSGPLEKSALGSSSPDKRYSHGVSSSIVNEASEPRIRALIEELRSLIVTYGYRKSEIARALGVHPTQVDRWLSLSYTKCASITTRTVCAILLGVLAKASGSPAVELFTTSLRLAVLNSQQFEVHCTNEIADSVGSDL